MRTSRLIPAVLLAASAACGGSSPGPAGPGDGPTGEPSSYDLQVASITMKGNSGVETSWDADLGLLYLGADEVTQNAIGTVTLQLGPVSNGTNGGRRADVLQAAVSTTLARVGTAEELDAHLYQLSPIGLSEISGIKNGIDYIEGTVEIFLEQVLPAPPNGTPPATAILTGTFRAVND